MSTTIFTAGYVDPEKRRRKRQIIVGIVALVVIVVGLFYMFRYWPYEHRVDQFFAALEQKNFEQAYGIYQNDPQWQRHPDRYKKYSYQDFYRDWGPGGDWGIVRSHKIDGAVSPKHGGSGVIVQVTVNDRIDKARLWVEKKDKTLTPDFTMN